MKACVSHAGVGVALLLAAGVLLSPDLTAGSTPASTENAQGDPSAEELVQAALEAEASGDDQRRSELLRQALSVDPESAPARWRSGYLRVDDQWLPVEEAERRAAADDRLAEYRSLREKHAGTPMGELALARWCRDKELEDEARFHWRKVLQFAPQHKEALNALGVRRHHGRLLTRDQIKEAEEKRADQQQRRRDAGWEEKRSEEHSPSLVSKWRRQIEQSDATFAQFMQEEVNADSSRLLDSLVLERSGARDLSKRQQEAYKTLSLKLVEIHKGSPQKGATSSLLRHALNHPVADVRTAAADALGERPMESYVPQLLGLLRSPIEADFAVVTHPYGGVSYQYSLYREGPDADYRETGGRSAYFRTEPDVVRLPPISQRGGPNWEERFAAATLRARAATKAKLAQGSLRARATAAATAVQTQRRVEQSNAATIQRNRRIQYVLRRATGADPGTRPADWWEWWRDRSYDHYELEKPYGDYASTKPVYENRSNYSRSSNVTVPVKVPPRRYSCFARGTKVWTLTGPTPIEEMRAGDRVLSQNPRSGELAYRRVLQTTARNPSPMVKINLGSETITATRGHMFWVSGKGWQMAKELSVGSPLRGVHGAVAIDRLEDAPAAGPWYEQLEERPDAKPGDELSYNLIVEGFHTYFVGEERLLVRDNFYREIP